MSTWEIYSSVGTALLVVMLFMNQAQSLVERLYTQVEPLSQEKQFTTNAINHRAVKSDVRRKRLTFVRVLPKELSAKTHIPRASFTSPGASGWNSSSAFIVIKSSRGLRHDVSSDFNEAHRDAVTRQFTPQNWQSDNKRFVVNVNVFSA